MWLQFSSLSNKGQGKFKVVFTVHFISLSGWLICKKNNNWVAMVACQNHDLQLTEFIDPPKPQDYFMLSTPK